MAFDNAYPTSSSTLSTMTQWEAFWVGGLGGAAGVIAGTGSELIPSINSSARSVSLGSGAALVRGFYSNNPSTYTATVPTQSAGDRVDRMVLRLDRTAMTAPNWIKPTIIQGTSGSSSPPAVQSGSTGSWDLLICRWTTKADGTLTGLVDERSKLGGSFVAFTSTGRPAASPPRLGWETDTSRLLLADGTSWSAVFTDSDWFDVPVTGHWQAGSYAPQVRRRDQVICLRGSVTRTVDTLQSTVVNSQIAALTSDFFPQGTHNFTTLTSAVSPARLQISPSGVLAIVDLAADLTVGRSVYLDTTYFWE